MLLLLLLLLLMLLLPCVPSTRNTLLTIGARCVCVCAVRLCVRTLGCVCLCGVMRPYCSTLEVSIGFVHLLLLLIRIISATHKPFSLP